MSNIKDKFDRPIVAVTGMGVISSLGRGKEENWRRLTAGESGIHHISRFPTEGLRTTIAGTVDFLPESNAGASVLSEILARISAHEAIEQAGLEPGNFGGRLVLAAPPVELDWKSRFTLDQLICEREKQKTGKCPPPSYQNILEECRLHPQQAFFDATQFGHIAEKLAEYFGTIGLPVSLSTACASGTTAIQMGIEAIRRGEDRALVIGTDGSVSAEALIRFSLLSALSTHNEPPEKASKPFSKDRDGFVMAEGSGALVLESLEAALARGAQVLGILAGCGETADDFHRTRSKPDASPAIGSMRAAIHDAGLEVGDIDYINAHGTSTPENEKMEYMAMSSVFGDILPSVPVSSNKSMIGHTLTAAGAIEAVFSLLTIRDGLMPPTINYDHPDETIPLDVVPNVARKKTVRSVLSNSFGFGGQNSSVVLQAYEG